MGRTLVKPCKFKTFVVQIEFSSKLLSYNRRHLGCSVQLEYCHHQNNAKTKYSLPILFYNVEVVSWTSNSNSLFLFDSFTITISMSQYRFMYPFIASVSYWVKMLSRIIYSYNWIRTTWNRIYDESKNVFIYPNIPTDIYVHICNTHYHITPTNNNNLIFYLFYFFLP